MQHTSGRAENSIQVVSILISAFPPDQCPVPRADISEKQVWRAGKVDEKSSAPNCFSSLLLWRLSSILNKFKDGEREERIAGISAWKQQHLKTDHRQPIHNLSSHCFFNPLQVFEKPGPS